MDKIQATFKAITPMFLSGADQQKAELRLPSIKGALRFWWRALAWARNNRDLESIREEEANLFGSSDAGQAAVLMKLDPIHPKTIPKGDILCDAGEVVGIGARYLGYGVMEAFDGKHTVKGRLTRPCFEAPFDFVLRLRFHPKKKVDQQSVLSSIKLMGLFGNLGSKSRKGYGSLTLTKLLIDGQNKWLPPQSIQEFLIQIQELGLPQFNGDPSIELPKYTAFSQRSRMVLMQGNPDESPLGLLHRIGRDLIYFRSWGRDKRITEDNIKNGDSEKNFENDHDLMNGTAARIPHPERVVFGLPHNYGGEEKLHVKPMHFDRRASPLFIHIYHTDGANPIAVLSFLRAAFLPNNEELHVLGNPVPLNQKGLWDPIDDFLDRLLDSEQGKEQFADAQEVI